MDAFTRVLALLDADPASQRVLVLARSLANQWRLPALLVSAVTSDDAATDAYRRLEASSAGFDGAVDVEVRRSSAVRSSLLTVLRRDPDAIAVMATHALRPIRELVLGSVASDLVRKSPVPIVLAGPATAAPPPGGYDELIACIDGSERSAQLVAMARITAQLGMRTTLLEVHAGDRPLLDESAADMLRDAGITFDRTTVRDDHPARGILTALDDRPSALVAIASRGRDPYSRVKQPSSAIAVTREARNPVVVLGPACRAVSSEALTV